MANTGVFLRRVRIRNYKSIAECDVQLGRLTLLVGRNGAGKSNFLDALRFVSDSLETSLDHALKSRGGMSAVRRISTGHPRNIQIMLQLVLEDRQAQYEFELRSESRGGFSVREERLTLESFSGSERYGYHIRDGQVISVTTSPAPTSDDLVLDAAATQGRSSPFPPPAADRLSLVVASGLPEFRPAYDALRAMGFYNLNPDVIREIQKPDAGELLRRDGSNLASVISRLAEDRPEVQRRIQEYLRQIVPEVVDVQRVAIGHHETLQFRQRVPGAEHPWRFYAGSMSDGTLRTLGILVAVMQLVGRKDPIRLVGIEEPETALHPAAAGSLMDALREAARNTQVLATTHSPDLLDQFDPQTDTLLVVQVTDGRTTIGPVDDASLGAVRDHLFTAGELLRMDQLQPAPRPPEQEQLKFFAETPA
jgi:predicted ATPase